MAASPGSATTDSTDKLCAHLPRLNDWVMNSDDAHRRFSECREDARIMLSEISTLTPTTSTILSRFATGLYKVNAYEEGEASLSRLLAYRRAQDPAGSGAINTWNNWALCLAEIPERVGEAEREFCDLLVAVRSLRGHEHTSTLVVWRNWATALIKVDRATDAADQLRLLYVIRVRQDGATSDSALTARAYCAYAACKSGIRREQGQAELRVVLTVMQQVHGPDHARTKDIERVLSEVSECDVDETDGH